MNRSRTILLVEDNPDDVELALVAFNRGQVAGDVVVVSSGEQALDYLFAAGEYASRRSADPPEVVLLDLNLPKLDGFEVLRRLRADERTRRLPVVMLTSSKDEQDVVRSYDLGANSFVQKPVDFDRFVDTARQLGSYWLVLNEPPPPAAAPGTDTMP